MPNVNAATFSPPVSGNVDEPHHPQSCYNQATIAGQVRSSSTLACSEPNSEDAYALLINPPGLPKQHELESVNVVEVSGSPVKNADEPGSIEDAQESDHQRSKEEVIKEIGISSTAFIGPSCRPHYAIEEELSEFYKELEEIDHPDTVDGKTENNEDLSQTYISTSSPTPRKASRGTDLKKAHTPYPPPRSHGWPRNEYGNTRRWRPQSHNNMTWDGSFSYSYQRQWEHTPPRLPQDLQRIQFLEPPRFFPPPPPGNPMHRLYFEARLHDYGRSEGNSWGSSEGTRLPHGCGMGHTSSNQPVSYERFERNSSGWQPYEEQDYYHEEQYQHNGASFVLVLMRGLPGSGKSTLAKELVSAGSAGLILSTDDFFFQENGYFFDATALGDAHDWNQKRARQAMLEGHSPVVIDNTNIQAWEMKPYVAMALEIGYRVEFAEPTTSWKCDPVQLEKRNKHGVPRETIEKMLGRFELPMTVDIVMNSCEPPRKSKENLTNPQKRFDM